MDDLDPLLPENISDETARALCDFLYALTAACESRYLTQLHRERASREQALFDPDHPWKSKPPNR
jgi:hypothetical protein